MDEKSIFIEKLTEKLPEHYLCGENHTNYAMVTRCKTWLDVQRLMDEENWNFLGITTPPYNPYADYSAHLKKAGSIENR